MTAQRWLSVCPWSSCFCSLWTADEEGDLKISMYSWVFFEQTWKQVLQPDQLHRFFLFHRSVLWNSSCMVRGDLGCHGYNYKHMECTHNAYSHTQKYLVKFRKTLEIWVTITTPPTLHNLYHTNDNTELSMIIGTASNFTWEMKNTLLFYILIFMFVDLSIQPNVKALSSLLLSYFLQPLDVV